MSFDPETINELPETVPVFPLEGVLLLPRGQLPLNIFEPRYLQMFEDALARGGFWAWCSPMAMKVAQKACKKSVALVAYRLFPRPMMADDCLADRRGALCHCRRLNAVTPYRQIRADYRPYESDLIADVGSIDVNRDGVLDVLKRYLDANGMEADWPAIESSNNEALVNSLCIISPYGPQEKQAMLEAATLGERAEILIALTEMVLAQLAQSGGANDNAVQ